MTAGLLAAALVFASPDVEVTDCPHVDAERLGELVALEIPSERNEGDLRDHVELRCEEHAAFARVVDRDGAVALERELPPITQDGRERSLALVFGQLWSLAPIAPPVRDEPPVAPEPAEQTDPEPAPPPTRVALGGRVHAAGVGRSLEDDPRFGGRVGLGLYGELGERLEWDAGVRFDGLQVSADLGDVSALAISGVGALHFVLAKGPRYLVGLGPTAGAGWGWVRGRSSSPSVGEGSTQAAFFEGGVSSVLLARVGGIDVGGRLDAGYRLRQPEGIVGDGAVVSAGGLWAAAGVEVRFGLLRRVAGR